MNSYYDNVIWYDLDDSRRRVINPIVQLKNSKRPENQSFPEKKHERKFGSEKRRRTRPWDCCWFSNKPHIIVLTVEEALNKYPEYMLWCYQNLEISWSTYTIKMFDKYNVKPKRKY